MIRVKGQGETQCVFPLLCKLYSLDERRLRNSLCQLVKTSSSGRHVYR